MSESRLYYYHYYYYYQHYEGSMGNWMFYFEVALRRYSLHHFLNISQCLNYKSHYHYYYYYWVNNSKSFVVKNNIFEYKLSLVEGFF